MASFDSDAFDIQAFDQQAFDLGTTGAAGDTGPQQYKRARIPRSARIIIFFALLMGL